MLLVHKTLKKEVLISPAVIAVESAKDCGETKAVGQQKARHLIHMLPSNPSLWYTYIPKIWNNIFVKTDGPILDSVLRALMMEQSSIGVEWLLAVHTVCQGKLF